MNADAPDRREGPSLGWSVAAVLLAALAASLVGLSNGFALDDIPMVLENPRLRSLDDPAAFFRGAYWNVPGIQAAAWRPLSLLAFAVQWVMGAGAPVVFHATSILLYALVCVVTLGLLRALVAPRAALVAGLLFAVHPVHVESVANVVGQAELWVALFVITACTVFLRARSRHALSVPAIGTIVACYVLALGFKEHALVLPGVLVAAELLVVRSRRVVGDAEALRVRALVYVLAVVAVLWFIVRVDAVGGVSAGQPHAALLHLGLGERSWVMLALVPEFVRLLFWPVALYADYAPQLVSVLPEPTWAHLHGAAWLLAWAVALAASWRRAPVVAFGLLWLPITLLLVANVVVPTGILLAERTLFLPSVGIVLVLAVGAGRLADLFEGRPRPHRVLAVGAGATLVVLAAAHSAERTAAWKDNFTLVMTLVTDAPYAARGQFWLGDELIRQGELASGETALRRAMQLWPEYPAVPLALGITYHSHGQCGPAVELYRRTLALDSTNAAAHFGHAGCLLNLGRFQEARMASFRGAAVARSSVAYRVVLYAADSALAANDSIFGNNWYLRRAARGDFGASSGRQDSSGTRGQAPGTATDSANRLPPQSVRPASK
jgi:hypothetical protein